MLRCVAVRMGLYTEQGAHILSHYAAATRRIVNAADHESQGVTFCDADRTKELVDVARLGPQITRKAGFLANSDSGARHHPTREYGATQAHTQHVSNNVSKAVRRMLACAKLSPGYERVSQLHLQRLLEHRALVITGLHKLSARQLIDVIWSNAKLWPERHHSDDFCTAVAAELSGKRGNDLFHLPPKKLATLAWSVTKCGISDPGVWRTLIDCTKRNEPHFSIRDASLMLWSLSNARKMDSGLCDKLLARVQANFDQVNSTDASHILYSVSKLQLQAKASTAGLIHSCTSQHLARMRPEQVATSCWALANLAVQDQDVLQYVQPAVLGALRHMTKGHLSLATWSLASLQLLDAPAGRQLARTIRKHRTGWKPQDLSNIAWGFVKAQQFNADVLAFISQQCRAALCARRAAVRGAAAGRAVTAEAAPDFSPLPGRILPAAAGCAIAEAAAQALPAGARHGSPAAAAGQAWPAGPRQAKAALPPLLPTAMPAAAGIVPAEQNDVQSVAAVEQLVPQSLSGLSRHRGDTLKSGTNVSSYVVRDPFKPQAVANLLWALASARHCDVELLNVFARHVCDELASYSAQELSNVAWGFATFNHYDVMLFSRLCQRVLEGAMAGLLAEPLQLAWAAAVLQHRDQQCYEAVAALLAQARPQDLPPHSLCQLYHIHILLNELGNDTLPNQSINGLANGSASRLVSGLVKFPSTLLVAAQSAWTLQSQGQCRVSSTQLSIAHSLKALGLAPRLEVPTHDGLFLVDIALSVRGVRVALEVDGPTHFTSNAPHSPLGPTLARWRALRRRGWAVASVPANHWSAVQQSGAAGERAFLQAVLGASLAAGPGGFADVAAIGQGGRADGGNRRTLKSWWKLFL